MCWSFIRLCVPPGSPEGGWVLGVLLSAVVGELRRPWGPNNKPHLENRGADVVDVRALWWTADCWLLLWPMQQKKQGSSWGPPLRTPLQWWFDSTLNFSSPSPQRSQLFVTSRWELELQYKHLGDKYLRHGMWFTGELNRRMQLRKNRWSKNGTV